MAKRLRQANLFETLAKKRATDEIEPSALPEELPLSGELCDDESDDSAAEEELILTNHMHLHLSYTSIIHLTIIVYV